MKKNKLNKKGFTLIEVVLVLAIGGLIFLLAFLAFQQVSRNRRDTHRRSSAARYAAEAQNYYTDKGNYPANAAELFFVFGPNYANDIKNPSGSNYTFVTNYSDLNAADKIYFGYNERCSSPSGGVTSDTGNLAFVIKLEAGGVTCRDTTGKVN